MTRLAPFLLAATVLTVAGCAGPSTAGPATVAPVPTIKGAPPADNGSIPKLSPAPGTSGPRATVKPGGKVPTLPPLPTPTAIPARDYTAVVQGTVTDNKNGAPIAGAVITVGQHLRVVKTDGFGRYHVSFPSGPPEPVEVNAPGYTGALAMGAINPHKAAIVNFKLNPKQAGKPGIPVPPQLFGHP